MKHPRIEVHPGVRRGQPCIRGTRITVSDVMTRLEGGWTEAELLRNYPVLRPADVRAARAYAAGGPTG